MSYRQRRDSASSTHPAPHELERSLEQARQTASTFDKEERQHKEETLRASSDAMRKRRRVAVLTNLLLDWDTHEPRFGGGERYCLTLARLLDDLGFDVTFYQSARRPFTGEYFGFKVSGIPHGEGFSEFQHGVCDAFYRLSEDYDHVIYNIANYASGRCVRDDAILICHGIWFDYESPVLLLISHARMVRASLQRIQSSAKSRERRCQFDQPDALALA